MPTSLSTPQTLPTGYTDKATLGPIENLEKIVWQNTNGVVVFQVGRLDPTGRPVFDQTEAVLPPGIWGMDKIYGIRFRSRDVAALATLDPCTGYFQDDPDPFNPGTVPGSTAAITGAVNVQHNDGLVASQPTLDFEDSVGATFAWSITNDGPNTRVKITPPDVVTSVFGRQGVVTAQSGDYLAAQVTNAADLSSGALQTFASSIAAGAGMSNAVGASTGAMLNSGGVLQVSRSGANQAVFTTTQPGDTTNFRFFIDNAGKIGWGAPPAVQDAFLERVAAGVLQTTSSSLRVPNGLTTYRPVNADVLTNFFLSTDTQPTFKIFAQGAMTWGAGGSTAADIELARIVNTPTGTGSFLEIINGDGFGYGTGTGGAVTQATSKTTTTPACNHPTGKVTMAASTLNAGQSVDFTVPNSTYGIEDTVIVTPISNGAGISTYQIVPITDSIGPTAGNMRFQITNTGTVSEGAAVVFQFNIIKGAIS